MISAIIACLVLLADFVFKQWGLIWLPLVCLMFTYLLYTETTVFTRFYDG